MADEGLASDLMAWHLTHTFTGDETLASGRQAHHNHADLGFIGLLGEISQVNPRHDDLDERRRAMKGRKEDGR